MSDKPRVLIVDDVEVNSKILAACLKGKYEMTIARDGQACLDIAITSPQPDLILLDIEMPGMNGYEVCKQLKNNSLTMNIPVIFVTANDREADEEKGLLLGAVDYITKPLRPLIVAARVNTHITLKQQHDQLLALATHDQLTGLYNRHYLFHGGGKKIAYAVRHQLPLSLAMMDVDYFKVINDQHGHPTGDAVLQAIAQLLGSQCREEDIVARFGGEEFIILFEHSDLTHANKKAEKLRNMIEQLEPEGLIVTMSFGVVQLEQKDSNLDDMIARADSALYCAKETGRNQVIGV
ncbi:GGDEF domain-containing response regulator [sulfur-oxidizing endosymbiont of Gigantopelta aegis]|uniref:GGDEF domain-containing response regulator n=1 Tax=sulfur-oxidizing endosymbiont of Gigantopelta aegis TaxID=2794934 RepID=UPI0018DEB91C|nr:diguanylate cyclase [sulfur-oxidizing endosymbiont of Gigantopelta aegis]